MVAWNDAAELRSAALGKEIALTSFAEGERKVRRDFWSKLKRVAMGGGAPIVVCEVPMVGRGGAWGADGTIVFLRRVVEGSAPKSYGIEVAKLAGLPRSIIERAREILSNLEANELDVTGRPKLARHMPSRRRDGQPSLFRDEEVKSEE